MKTLNKLRAGLLTGHTTLSLSCGLTTFPGEIFDLADTLEVLDLTHNKLERLPDDFDRLKKLRILFLSENNFTHIPAVLAKCRSLTMIGFKANKISLVGENVLPLDTQWLILTDNKIAKLPDSIGDLKKLQKCMLAGNKITAFPDSMQACKSLELLRISANALEVLPHWLFTLPRLSWLACAGNPCTEDTLEEEEDEGLAKIHWDKLTLHEELGEGASGLISRGYWSCESSDVAVKVFKGEVTSDGYPEDEMKVCIAVGDHDNLTTVHGKIHAHSEDKEGLILALIPPEYVNLGNPPTLQTCTRDTYEKGTYFSFKRLMSILLDVASSAEHLHARNIMHGDLYAHNILINDSGHSLLSDFGAATIYGHIKSIEGSAFERLEVRAFACLMEDLLAQYSEREVRKYVKSIEALQTLKDACMHENVQQRPLFSEIYEALTDTHMV